MTAILRARWFRVVRMVVCLGLLAAWTKALLTPIPPGAVKALGGDTFAFWFGKTLHVGVYATIALLITVLPFARQWRIALLAALVVHGGATEYLQRFFERGSSMEDWGRDTVGVLIGVALGWRWLRRRGEPLGEGPQVQPQGDARGEHQNAADLR